MVPLSTASTGRYVQTLTAAELFDHHLEVILIAILAGRLGSSAFHPQTALAAAMLVTASSATGQITHKTCSTMPDV